MLQKIDIDLSGPQFDIYRSQKERNLFHAGQGGGKTFGIGLISWMLVNICPEALGMIAANTYGQLSDSTLLECTNVWKGFGWTEYTKTNPDGFYVIDVNPPMSFVQHGHVFKTNKNKIFFRNGAVIMLASLDNYKTIEGRTISWALLDETSDTKEVAVKETITGRLRGSGIHINEGADKLQVPWVPESHPNAGRQANPLYIFTKPAKEQWLTEMFDLEEFRHEIQESIMSETDYFFKEFENKCVVICSAYHNIPHISRDYIETRKRELSKDQVDLLIYGSPFGKSGAEYYSNFDRRIHVGKFNAVDGLPIHFTLDFNVNPYMPANVWQLIPGTDGRIKVRCVREYAMTTPKNTIEYTCQTFRADFGHMCSVGLFYYGDATGKATLPIGEARDYYKIVEKELKTLIYPSSRRLLKQNPRHRALGHGTLGRREFMNALLSGAYGVDVEVDESCKHTIADFEFVKEDANGAKLKKIEDINGVKCQKYGHMSDAADALLCWNFGTYSKENSNEKVQQSRAA